MIKLAAARTAAIIVSITAQARNQKDPNQPFAAIVAAEETASVIAAIITTTTISAEEVAITAVAE